MEIDVVLLPIKADEDKHYTNLWGLCWEIFSLVDFGILGFE
jgi:hypothetical protein